MNLKQLEYIVAIEKEGSLSRAADRLFITRPALNHYLISLETELGVPLFKRTGRRLIPTVAGESYIRAAKQILEIKKQTYKELQDIAENYRGTISLGLTTGVGNAILRDVLPKFNRLYPHYSLNLLEGNIRTLETAVKNGDIDFAVVGYGSVPTDLKHITTISCEVVLVLPPDHPLGVRASHGEAPYATLDLNELRDDDFVLMNTKTNIRAIADKHFEMAGFQPKIKVECSRSSLAYHFVKEGIGPSILMEFQIKPEDGVHVFSLNPREIWYQSIAYREGTCFSKAEQCFIDLICRYFSETAVQNIFRQ